MLEATQEYVGLLQHRLGVYVGDSFNQTRSSISNTWETLSGILAPRGEVFREALTDSYTRANGHMGDTVDNARARLTTFTVRPSDENYPAWLTKAFSWDYWTECWNRAIIPIDRDIWLVGGFILSTLLFTLYVTSHSEEPTDDEFAAQEEAILLGQPTTPYRIKPEVVAAPPSTATGVRRFAESLKPFSPSKPAQPAILEESPADIYAHNVASAVAAGGTGYPRNHESGGYTTGGYSTGYSTDYTTGGSGGSSEGYNNSGSESDSGSGSGSGYSSGYSQTHHHDISTQAPIVVPATASHSSSPYKAPSASNHFDSPASNGAASSFTTANTTAVSSNLSAPSPSFRLLASPNYHPMPASQTSSSSGDFLGDVQPSVREYLLAHPTLSHMTLARPPKRKELKNSSTFSIEGGDTARPKRNKTVFKVIYSRSPVTLGGSPPASTASDADIHAEKRQHTGLSS